MITPLGRPIIARHPVAAMLAFAVLGFASASAASLRPLPQATPDMTGEYEFLSPENTLAILEEEGKLKGYIDVMQGEEESNEVLSYPIAVGTRHGDQVEFKTAKIHEKYYRFTGTVERGGGRTSKDGDFLRLTGDLDTVTADSATGPEHADHRHVTFKWRLKSEGDE